MTEPREEKSYEEMKKNAETLSPEHEELLRNHLALPKKEGEGLDWEAEFDKKFPVISNNGDIGDAVTRQFINLTLSQSFLIKEFIQANFLSRTAVENMIEEAVMIVNDKVRWARDADPDEVYQALRDLKEKIKKE